jgi:glutamyl-tRNA synthetase
LYDYLYARKTGGTCVLRIEDTDQSREVKGAAQMLISTLQELGIEFDESPISGGEFGPYTQSERLELYHKHAAELVHSGHAYPCFCSSETLQEMRDAQQSKGEFVKYDQRCLKLSREEVQAKLDAGTPHVIRLRMPDDRKFVIEDLIRGHVEMDAFQSDDQVLVKSDGFPTYHLAATVDDHYMQISHVIRGEEWLSSTPKHIWLYECLGWQAPRWVHLPLILNTDRSKLSKRMNDVSVQSYLQKGYLKEALLNFVALLGWHSADDRELYTLEELCGAFSLERVSKSGAIFDLTKLDWMNGQYLRSLPLEVIAERAKAWFSEEQTRDYPRYMKVIAAARERSTLLPDLAEYAGMFLKSIALSENDEELLQSESAQKVLTWYHKALDALQEPGGEEIQELTNRGIQELGIKGKNYYMPLRLALIGQQHGPDMPSTIGILGKEETLNRLSARIH